MKELISGVSRVLQKLLKYFNGDLISTYFVLPAVGLFPVIFALHLNDSESFTAVLSASYYISVICHKLPDSFE